MEKSSAFNASDSHILAGKNIVDDSSPLVTSLEEEKTFQSDICIQDKIVIDDGEDYNSIIAGKPPILESLICNSLEQIRVTNKRKREEQECEADFELEAWWMDFSKALLPETIIEVQCGRFWIFAGMKVNSFDGKKV
ncbi:hypothetical protein V6N11_036329 [Hibiscus sabdariffa]|uniref:Uncharacterized protein n=1 Tax=Hibiscus sabdariffa TaxID=183260 RepID=A0ABR2RAM1_9ROSI